MWKIGIILSMRSHIREGGDLESGLYDDLLSIEMAISEMVQRSMLDERELGYLDALNSSPTLTYAANICEVQHETFSKVIQATCSRIANFMGGSFTDEGFIAEVVETYNLPDDEIERLRQFIKSRERLSVKRVPFLPVVEKVE